ncbi:MAG: hypothetical protein ACT4P7_20610 [Gemmatimonadaceae bacterium]
MANLAGKSYGMTAFTRMRPWQTVMLRISFAFIGVLQKPAVQKVLANWKYVKMQQYLVQLSFIHFARWVIVPRNRYPRLAPDQPEETLRYDYLFFESNFNGSWDQYIDAFSAVIPGGMDIIWRWSRKYPGSQPNSPFLAYIRSCQYDTDYYYNATPGASATDVLGALDLHERLHAFAAASATATPGAFRQLWERFLSAASSDLATTGPRNGSHRASPEGDAP